MANEILAHGFIEFSASSSEQATIILDELEKCGDPEVNLGIKCDVEAGSPQLRLISFARIFRRTGEMHAQKIREHFESILKNTKALFANLTITDDWADGTWTFHYRYGPQRIGEADAWLRSSLRLPSEETEEEIF